MQPFERIVEVDSAIDADHDQICEETVADLTRFVVKQGFRVYSIECGLIDEDMDTGEHWRTFITIKVYAYPVRLRTTPWRRSARGAGA